MITAITTNEGSLVYVNESGSRETISKSMIRRTLISGVVLKVYHADGVSKDLNVATTIDGEEFATLEALQDKISSFKKGGDTGEGVETVTGDLVNNDDPKKPTVNLPEWANELRADRVGYLNVNNGFSYIIGTNGVDATKVMSSSTPTGLTNGTITFPNIPDRWKRHVIAFLVDIETITIAKQSTVTEVFNVPTKAKRGDIWTLTWDQGDRQWHLEAINSVPKWYIDNRAPLLTNGNFLIGGVSGNEQRLLNNTDFNLPGGAARVPHWNGTNWTNGGKNTSQAATSATLVERTASPNAGRIKASPGVDGDDAMVKSQIDVIMDGSDLTQAEGYDPLVRKILTAFGNVWRWMTIEELNTP